jgi:hypothetical protein
MSLATGISIVVAFICFKGNGNELYEILKR